jgi:hypothetical protein
MYSNPKNYSNFKIYLYFKFVQIQNCLENVKPETRQTIEQGGKPARNNEKREENEKVKDPALTGRAHIPSVTGGAF